MRCLHRSARTMQNGTEHKREKRREAVEDQQKKNRRAMSMYGAILGDIIGSPFEFDRGNKTKEFPLFSKNSVFTDDSVMTIAVADALLQAFRAIQRKRQKASREEAALRSGGLT